MVTDKGLTLSGIPPASLQKLKDLYRSWAGAEATEMSLLPMSGGARRYVRMSDSSRRTAMGAYGPDLRENENFFSMQGALRADGAAVPAIHAISPSRDVYLLEDLGDTSLFSLLGTDRAERLVAQAMDDLARIQTGTRAVGTAALIAPPFGQRLMRWDLNYFKYCFLKPRDVDFDEDALEDDFDAMCRHINNADTRLWGFMYRDCQSRNVMVDSAGCLRWIDFQGGRPGPCGYDTASFLWQARAGFSDDFRRRMTSRYARTFAAIRGIEPLIVEQGVYAMVPLRVLQTLGAYGFRGLIQRKPHFIRSIGPALRNLASLGRHGHLDAYPELLKISRLHDESE